MNQLCGSGLRAIALGMQQIVTGDSNIIVAGGMESMSMAPQAVFSCGMPAFIAAWRVGFWPSPAGST
ncbi:thiolase family protein [Mesorhizobium caraganae]|uniref:thiolase family protein n=1 Tax=Mesorhizobium caraganae TaxID=483206 RepID=UPI0035E3E92D